MATKKAAGTAKNLRDSQPKFLGVKKYHGEAVEAGNIIIRQRGQEWLSGPNTGMGVDHTIFALKNGKVVFSKKRRSTFNNTTKTKKVVSVK